jgi:hypothetical protein
VTKRLDDRLGGVREEAEEADENEEDDKDLSLDGTFFIT